ncbi:hypothetical protein [Curvivirga aplysinae]|uniref:hypothetical protein n=1 Tax=Curvivirga aplysinae TaxID=2529852 RepID=UPI0012BD50F6|nr:hypothetical protein [Curvivirga aplysinae]MTI08948.1 hypothetical protein [Curvivirga aplysinae]
MGGIATEQNKKQSFNKASTGQKVNLFDIDDSFDQSETVTNFAWGTPSTGGSSFNDLMSENLTTSSQNINKKNISSTSGEKGSEIDELLHDPLDSEYQEIEDDTAIAELAKPNNQAGKLMLARQKDLAEQQKKASNSKSKRAGIKERQSAIINQQAMAPMVPKSAPTETNSSFDVLFKPAQTDTGKKISKKITDILGGAKLANKPLTEDMGRQAIRMRLDTPPHAMKDREDIYKAEEIIYRELDKPNPNIGNILDRINPKAKQDILTSPALFERITDVQSLRNHGDYNAYQQEKAVLLKEIDEAYTDGHMLKDNLLYRLDPNKNLVPGYQLTSEEFNSPEVMKSIQENEAFKQNVSEEYFEKRGQIVQKYHTEQNKLMEIASIHHKATRIRELSAEIKILDNKPDRTVKEMQRLRVLEGHRNQLWKTVHAYQQKRKLEGQKWDGKLASLEADIKQQAKQSVEIYKKLLLTPGLPHAKYDPAAAEAQEAMEKGDLERVLELGFDLSSFVPVGAVRKIVGTSAAGVIQWGNWAGSAYSTVKAGQQARQKNLQDILRENKVDLTNPKAVETFFISNPDLQMQLAMTQLAASLGSHLSSHLTGKIARDISGGDPIAEKGMEKSIQSIGDYLLD